MSTNWSNFFLLFSQIRWRICEKTNVTFIRLLLLRATLADHLLQEEKVGTGDGTRRKSCGIAPELFALHLSGLIIFSVIKNAQLCGSRICGITLVFGRIRNGTRLNESSPRSGPLAEH